jgi:homoserine dehydrogenase
VTTPPSPSADTTSQPERPLRVLLLGAGSLGRTFLRRVRDRGGPVHLVGVLTGHRGRWVDAAGIDPSHTLELLDGDGLGEQGPADFKRALEAGRPEVVVECIPQNIRSGEPALGYHRAALDLGVHVVTANKAPIALGYRDLRQRAARHGARFRFEAAVLDGLPVFSLVQQLGGAAVTRVRGVLNGTSSAVLESVALGASRSRGLARAQAQGIAESDSVLDLDGWDAAAKAALLGNVWMGGALRVVDVARKGCDDVKDDRIRKAAEVGARFRLVAEVERNKDGVVRASVEPQAIEPGDPLHSLRGTHGGMTLWTDAGQQFTLLQEASGIDDAALGLLNDLRAIIAGAPQP